MGWGGMGLCLISFTINTSESYGDGMGGVLLETALLPDFTFVNHKQYATVQRCLKTHRRHTHSNAHLPPGPYTPALAISP